jgi:type VI secretion system secreted protein Hcp
MKISLPALVVCFCFLVPQGLVFGAFGQDPSASSPFANYNLAQPYVAETQPSGLEVVADRFQSADQPLPESGTGQMTMGPGGSSEGVNGIFLSLEGVPGESAIEAHRNWIDVLSFNYGIQNPASIPASGGGMRAGLPQFGDLVITKQMDKASPQLYLAASNGKHIALARLEVIKGGRLVLVYRLSDVTVGAVEVAGEGTDIILEKVSLKYGRIEWTYIAVDPTGQELGEFKTGWDLAANRA